MKAIKYELKSLNTFVTGRFLTPLDRTLRPVIIKTFSYDSKRNSKKKQQLQKIKTSKHFARKRCNLVITKRSALTLMKKFLAKRVFLKIIKTLHERLQKF